MGLAAAPGLGPLRGPAGRVAPCPKPVEHLVHELGHVLMPKPPKLPPKPGRDGRAVPGPRVRGEPPPGAGDVAVIDDVDAASAGQFVAGGHARTPSPSPSSVPAALRPASLLR
ncbi:MAG: hypothetical protein ACK559_00005, partial [bacterium]